MQQCSKSRAYYSYDDNTMAISSDGSRKIGILLTLARSKLGLKNAHVGYKLVNKNILQIF